MPQLPSNVVQASFRVAFNDAAIPVADTSVVFSLAAAAERRRFSSLPSK
jgi:hypothetical protein